MTNKILIYKFDLEIETPLRIGGNNNNDKDKSILKDRKGNPLIFGSSIAGAIRSYLRRTELNNNNGEDDSDGILSFMGGESTVKIEDSKDATVAKEFKESKVVIEDGKITQNTDSNNNKFIEKKEGTRINSEFATAEQKMKYEYEYVAPRNKLSFKIEYELDQESEIDIDKIMMTIARGFEDKTLRFGSQKNNDFGSFKVESLKKLTWELSKVKQIESYIEFKNGKEYIEDEKYWNFNKSCKCDNEEWDLTEKTITEGYILKEKHNFSNDQIYKIDSESKNLTIELEGEFPYGVYQNFEKKELDKTITGIKDMTIPASSMKGLLRHHIEKMFNTITKDNNQNVTNQMEKLFGGQESAGLIHCFDIKLPDDRDEQEQLIANTRNQVEKPGTKNKVETDNVGHVSYVKINRMTGGNIDHALVSQVENKGKANIKIELKKDNCNDKQSIFPLLYTLIRIANGELAIGGKTNMGLGIFKANKIKINNEEIANCIVEIVKNAENTEIISEDILGNFENNNSNSADEKYRKYYKFEKDSIKKYFFEFVGDN